MNTKSISQVVKIEEQRITFSDGEVLEYTECFKIFNSIYPDSNSNCIAQRDITANPPYFEFYANKLCNNNCIDDVFVTCWNYGWNTCRKCIDINPDAVLWG